MSTRYNGKINFTKEELMTKYDKMSLLDNLQIHLSFPYGNVPNYISDRKIGKQLLLNIKRTSKKIAENVDKDTVVHKKYASKVDDWIDQINDEIDFDYSIEDSESFNFECEYCKVTNFEITRPTILKDNKFEFINSILHGVLYGLKGCSDLLFLCEAVQISDPEFLLKASLFCRREFNVRTVSNHLLALSASFPQSNIYLKKYFNVCINLPTDWIEVAQQYMITFHSIKLPAQLRRAMISKFKEFTTYQIGKYQNKSMEVEVEGKKIHLTLKSLIRTLHISEPVDHVMCLLGKNYPKSNEEFVTSNLPGEWDPERAGKRMKVPIPETWETQISINGNKPEIWEKLIDSKKLPYMAMIRNLRNILQANVKDKYHDKVAFTISQESKVINGKLLPFQYFTAFKILEEYNESISTATSKLSEVYTKDPLLKRDAKGKGKTKGNKKAIRNGLDDKKNRIRKIVMLRKIMGRPLVSETVIQKYTKALNKAVEISTTYNIPCIRGRVLILSNVGDETLYSKFKFGTNKSVKEVVGLLSSMCYFASEYTDIVLVKGTDAALYGQEKRAKSLLTLSSDLLKYEFANTFELDAMFSEMISKQIQYDLILLFDVKLERNLLVKYSKLVNPSVSIVVNNISSSGDESMDCGNISTIVGFNEHVIKIISEQSNGGFVRKIDSIDKRYNLNDNTICFKKTENLSSHQVDADNQPDEQVQVTDINIFISSTFLDMDRERSFINKVIVPTVKKQLRMQNINFFNVNCIDLRWGVPTHLGCSEEMLKYCIEQVKRCHIFVGVLGTRYGWIPDYAILTKLSETYPELLDLDSHSITHIEYKFAPKNCQKIFLLQSLPEDMNADLNLEKFHNEIKNNEIFYKYSPENLLTDFKILIQYISKTIRDNYVTQDLKMSHICPKHQRFNRQKMVKHALNRFIEYFTRNFETQRDAVEEIISKLEHNLKIKVKLYCDSKKRDQCDNAVDKKKLIVKEEMIDKFGGIVLIEGKIGSGKTSIMAGIIKEFISPKYEDKYFVSGKLHRRQFIWIYDSVRYIYEEGGKRMSLYDLLYDMIEFIMLDLGYIFVDKLKHELGLYGDVCDLQEFWKPSDIRTAIPVWNALLKIISLVDGIQITIFLDGLSDLDDSTEACSLNWIPLSLSSKVRFVIAAATDSMLSRCIRSRNDYVIYEIKPIQTKFKRTVIENLLMAQGKSLDAVPFNDQMSEFTLKCDSDKPKYLEMAVHYLLLYATFDKVKETIRAMPSTLEPLILHSMKSIEKEIPKEICMVYFSFIFHSKSGLRNEDLQNLMSVYFTVLKNKNNMVLKSSDFNDLKDASKLPPGFSLYPLILLRNFSHLLIEESLNQRLFIKDKTIRSVIGRYCEPINIQTIHFILSLYYDDLIERSSDEIAFRNVIYHKYHSLMFDECLKLLTAISFINKRFQLGLADGLLNDYIGFGDTEGKSNDQWLSICQDKKFMDFKNFVTKNFVLLSNNPDLFLQQAINEPIDSCVRLTFDDVLLSPYNFSKASAILKLDPIDTDNHKVYSAAIPVQDKVTSAALSPKMMLIVIGYDSGLIQLFSSVHFQMLFNLRQHVLHVNGLCFIDQSKKIVSVGEDNKALIWNAEDGSLLHELNGHYRSVTDCGFCVKADIICTVGLDCQCLLWRHDNYNLHHTFKSGSPINCMTVCNSKILVGCWDGNMIIYNAMDLVRTAIIHNTSSVRSVSINEFYPIFLATNIQGSLTLWNSTKGTKLKEFTSDYHKNSTCVKFSSDGLKFIEYGGINSHHETVSVWCTSLGYNENGRKVEDVCCIDSNSTFIVYGTRYGTVSILDRATLHTISKDNVSDSELTAISINRSEKSFKNCFAVTDYYNALHLFEIIDKAIVSKMKIDNIHNRPVKSLSWSSCYIVSGSDDCSLNVINMKERSTNNFTFSVKDLFLNSVLSIDIRKGRILAGCKDKSIALICIEERSILNHQIQAHDDWVTCISFLSSVSFVSGSNDSSIKIWQMTMESNEDGEKDQSRVHFSARPVLFTVLHTLVGHIGLVTSLSFDKSELIASSSNDGTIKLWKSQGIFADNLIIKQNNIRHSSNVESIVWVKFHDTNGTLLALDNEENLSLFNFGNNDCEISCLTSHQGPVTCAINADDQLYTLSLDSSMRQWNVGEILASKKVGNHRIIDSLYVPNFRAAGDIIVTFTDTGLLLFMDKDTKNGTWHVVDTVDAKKILEDHQRRVCFSSPYLVCERLKWHNDTSFDILFSDLTLRYDIQKKTLKKVAFQEPEEDEKITIDCDDSQINDNMFVKLIRDGTTRYYVRIGNKSNLLELISLDPITKKVTCVAKIPLSGQPCHLMVFKTTDSGNTCLVAYEQGTLEFIVLKQTVS